MWTGEGDAGSVALCELAGIGDAQPEHYAGNFGVEGEESNVFAAHDGFCLFDVFLGRVRRLRLCAGAQRAMNRSGLLECSLRYFYDGHAIGRNSVGLGEAVGGAANVGEDAVAESGGVSSERHA